MERLGWAGLFLWASVLITWAILKPEPYMDGWRLVLELAFFGRVVSIADGVTSDFSSLYLAVQNIPQDIILLLIVFPWVVRAHQGLRQRGILGRAAAYVHSSAQNNRRYVEPFGLLGLWAFVFFPFWSTGTLIGGVVGYLLGMRLRLILISVIAGHTLSCFVMIYFFEEVEDWLATFDRTLVRFLPWIILVLLFLITYILKRLFNNRAQREDVDHEDSADSVPGK